MEREKIVILKNTPERQNTLKDASESLNLSGVEELYQKAVDYFLNIQIAEGDGYEIVGRDLDGEILSLPEILGQSSSLVGFPTEDEVPWNVIFLPKRNLTEE